MQIRFFLLSAMFLTVFKLLGQETEQAQNVIFLIADGTATTQITAGLYALGDEKSSYERMKSVGFHKQHSHDALITDSAAGATAFACGVKTYNGAIGVDADTIPRKTLLEEAEMRGFSTGLVATSTIVHATPASFAAHVTERHLYEEIAADMSDADVDYMVGGGYTFFAQRENDERNIINEMSNKGYTVHTYLDEEMDYESLSSVEKFAFLTAHESPLPRSQGREYLIPSSMAGIDFLDEKSGDNGFFIMIEGSQIDWGGHANAQDYLIDEMMEFDKLLGRVLDWAEKDGSTLVVVTGDHECGGVALSSESKPDSLVLDFTSDYHTGAMVPVFSYGPGSDLFCGIYNNTEIYNKIRRALAWEDQTNEK